MFVHTIHGTLDSKNAQIVILTSMVIGDYFMEEKIF
jgi:hypothetical protein